MTMRQDENARIYEQIHVERERSRTHREELEALVAQKIVEIAEGGEEPSPLSVASAVMSTFDTTCNTSDAMLYAAYSTIFDIAAAVLERTKRVDPSDYDVVRALTRLRNGEWQGGVA